MVKSPAFQWYPKDYLTSERVAMMDLKTEGAYRRALDFCWLNGSLPADEKQLARIIGKGCTPSLAKEIKELFYVDPENPDRLLHERLEAERCKQENFRASKSQNGKLGGRPKKETENTQQVDNKENDELNKKAIAFENESETKAKKSSPISYLHSPVSNLQSPSPSSEKIDSGLTPENQPEENLSEPVVQETDPLTTRPEEEKKVAAKKRTVAPPFEPPTFDEILTHFQLLAANKWDPGRVNFEAKKFQDFYESKGWMVGKNKMQNWKAAISGWINRNNEPIKTNHNGKPNTQNDYDRFREAAREAGIADGITDNTGSQWSHPR